MFYCLNISGCHVGLLHGRNARVILAPGRWWLSHVTHELMLWSKASLSTWVLGLFSCLLKGETQTVSTSCLHLVQLQKLKAETSLMVQWLNSSCQCKGHGFIPGQRTKISYATVQFSCPVISESLRTQGMQHARPPCPSTTPGGYSNSCPSS